MGVEKKGSKALLVLADGTVFEGRNFGFKGETIGEVVFNTSMTGYQEIITDPSYKGQIVVMTYTQIGNYGINDKDVESKQPNVEGFVVKEYLNYNSSWRSKGNLNDYLRENRITGLSGLDTRALTSHLRDNGVQMGIISAVDLIPESLLEKVRKHPGISAADLVKEVTAEKSYKWMEGVWKPAYEKVRSQE
ncbi:MAG: carbamoyl phosphate synthase small subunit, partial [Nitrospirae bacterium]|nr:carbamoyl phosphate synthase small subunit [Nitrospirota bacterium]